MKCGFDRELLSLYADGALSPERLSHLETHISECEECRRALEIMRDMWNALASLPRERAPDELIGRILSETGAATHRTAWTSVRWTAGSMWTAAIHGFRIEDERAEFLRKELPGWVARWVMFV